ncbi:MAG: YlbF family regulator [Clostridiales bacterium]|nr:YlbF family regulator [Clostridiales bacterium]MCD8214813.1 YlbF family regulator [Clostridiales bacterium]
MEDLYNSIANVCREFENSSVLSDYLAAKAEVEADKESLSKIREFQKLHLKVNEKEAKGQEDFGLRHHASTTYFELLRTPVCARFINAENRLLSHLKYYDDCIKGVLKKKGINGFGGDEQ